MSLIFQSLQRFQLTQIYVLFFTTSVHQFGGFCLVGSCLGFPRDPQGFLGFPRFPGGSRVSLGFLGFLRFPGVFWVLWKQYNVGHGPKGQLSGQSEGETFVADIDFNIFSIGFRQIFNLFSIDLHQIFNRNEKVASSLYSRGEAPR